MNNGKHGKKAVLSGWSVSASRRNVAFLRSVRTDHLTGHGWSFTLTVKDCPDTPHDWHSYLDTYLKRLTAAGALRVHWVIEWQRRGVPHLHGSVYFSDSVPSDAVRNVLIEGWCFRNPWRPTPAGQDMKQVYDAVGWAQYVAKHVARGVKHYQRSPENVPEGWKGLTGRIWGYRGLWPRQEPVRLELEGTEGDRGWFAFRRLVRLWAVSQARSRPHVDWSAVTFARHMLKSRDRRLSEVRGLSSWVPDLVAQDMCLNLADRGFAVRTKPLAEVA